jgi:hypothetical protein
MTCDHYHKHKEDKEIILEEPIIIDETLSHYHLYLMGFTILKDRS